MEKIRTNFTSTSYLNEADRCSKYNVQQLIIRRKSDVAKLANLSIEEMAKLERNPLNPVVVDRMSVKLRKKEMQRIEDSMEGWSAQEKIKFYLHSQIIWDPPLTDPPSGIEWEQSDLTTHRTVKESKQRVESVKDYEILEGKVSNSDSAAIVLMRMANVYEPRKESVNYKSAVEPQSTQQEKVDYNITYYTVRRKITPAMKVSKEEPLDKSIISELTEEIERQRDKDGDKMLSQTELVERCNYIR